MIGDSALPERVKENSLAVFRRLALSESKMHATTIEKAQAILGKTAYGLCFAGYAT